MLAIQFYHLAGDDHAMDLGRAIVDTKGTGGLEPGTQREVAGYTFRATYLNGTIQHPIDGFGDKDLAHGCLLARVVSLSQQPSCMMNHQPSSVEFGSGIGQHPLNGLVLREGTAKGFSL